jgi:fucose 4-O-acetylase-like acetyltransferase
MTPTPNPERRSDLDALRGFAMLLGIALHAALSFFGGVWPIHDARQSGLLPLAFTVIHGFRMPLFFLLSGFFTMLVFTRRGLLPLLRQRVERILVPLVVSVLTIVPLVEFLIDRGLATERREPLVAAIVEGDTAGVERLIAMGADPNGRDATYHRPLLVWAALAGHSDTVRLLADAGAALDAVGPVGLTPLHAAALCGREKVVAILIERGANPYATAVGGTIPLEALARSPTTVASTMRMYGLPDIEAADIAAGRRRVRAILESVSASPPRRGPAAEALGTFAGRYWRFLASDLFLVDLRPVATIHLIDSNVFEHLWFLWYLCWLVAAFALAAVTGCLPTGRQLWGFVAASCLCQAFMGPPHSQLFGPDVALGILPPPHLLASYGCFYFFGAAAFARDGTSSRLGRGWRILLPLGLLVLFPASIAMLANRPASIVLQPAYAWAMSLGLIGLFHRFCSRPSRAVAWLSDASYWMYLAHLPLVIAAQLLVRDWPLPALLKFTLVVAGATAVLLLTYRYAVRFTIIGRTLNGPR